MRLSWNLECLESKDHEGQNQKSLAMMSHIAQRKDSVVRTHMTSKAHVEG